MLVSTFVHLKWDSVPGTVTGWEIVQTLPNGSKVKSTAGQKARTTKLAFVGGVKKISVFDLPRRSVEQQAELVGEIV